MPEIVIKKEKKQRGQVEAAEPTLEERILAAAEKFRSELSYDVERTVLGLLEDNYAELLYQRIGFRRDHWGGKIEWDGYGPHADRSIRDALLGQASLAAAEAIGKIDFSTVELTPAQVKSIRTAYGNALKREVEHAARRLAEEDAIEIARKVLDLPETDLPEEEEMN